MDNIIKGKLDEASSRVKCTRHTGNEVKLHQRFLVNGQEKMAWEAERRKLGKNNITRLI